MYIGRPAIKLAKRKKTKVIDAPPNENGKGAESPSTPVPPEVAASERNESEDPSSSGTEGEVLSNPFHLLDPLSLHIICSLLAPQDVDALALASPLTFLEVLRCRSQPITITDRLVKALGWLSRRRPSLDLPVEFSSITDVQVVCAPAVLPELSPDALGLVTSYSTDYRSLDPALAVEVGRMTRLTSLCLVGPRLATPDVERLGHHCPLLKSLELRETLPLNYHMHDGAVCLNHLNDPFTPKQLRDLRKGAPPLSPRFIRSMPALESLTLETFRLENNFWSNLPSGLTKLVLPGLQRDQLTFRGARRLVLACPALQHLALTNGFNVPLSVINALAGLPHIRSREPASSPEKAAPFLSHLTFLDLTDFHDLTDDDLPSLARFTALKVLNLSGCYQITDDGLAHLLPLKALVEVELLNMTPEEGGEEMLVEVGGDVGLRFLAQLPDLEVLRLPDAPQVPVTDLGLRDLCERNSRLRCLEITGAFQTLQPLTSLASTLTQLVLWNEVDAMDAAQCALLGHLTQLTALTLTGASGPVDGDHDSFTWVDPGALSAAVARMRQLTYLTLDTLALAKRPALPEDDGPGPRVPLSPEIFEGVAQLPRLEVLELMDLTHVDFGGVGQLSTLTALTRVSLQSLEMGDRELGLLGNALPSLRCLEIAKLYHLTYQFPKELAGFKGLLELSLGNVALVDKSFRFLATAVPDLTSLSIYMSSQTYSPIGSSATVMTGSGLKHLSALTNLRMLSIDGYTEEGCACFERLDDHLFACMVAPLARLETLRMQGIDQVTAAALLQFGRGHTALRDLALRDCRAVSFEDMERLKKDLPHVMVLWHPDPDVYSDDEGWDDEEDWDEVQGSESDDEGSDGSGDEYWFSDDIPDSGDDDYFSDDYDSTSG